MLEGGANDLIENGAVFLWQRREIDDDLAAKAAESGTRVLMLTARGRFAKGVANGTNGMMAPAAKARNEAVNSTKISE